MEENIDQVQDDTQTQEGTEQVSKEQSETTSEQEIESKLFRTPDGRELTADEIYNEYNKLLPEFTRRSQKLSEYEKTMAEREKRAESQAQEALDSNELLENVDPNVKEAISQIALKTLKTYIEKQEAERAQAEKDREWNSRFEKAEKAHDGKDGLPKFDKNVILDFMMKTEIYDPEIAYREMHSEVIQDKLIKEALTQKGGSVHTESTGGSAPRKPEGKTPSTFEEAAKSAFARLNS